MATAQKTTTRKRSATTDPAGEGLAGVPASRGQGVAGAAGKKLLDAVREMCDAQSAGDYEAYINESQFTGVAAEIARAMNASVHVHVDNILALLGTAGQYAAGDLSAQLRPLPGKQVVANQIMDQLRANLQALVDDAGMLAQAGQHGDYLARSDVERHQGCFRDVVDGVGQALDAVADRVFWYEGLLDAIPFPISVTDMDMHWTFINKPVEQLLGIRRADVVGQPCSKWNADICGTERCGVAGLRKGTATSTFRNAGSDLSFRVDTSYILDRAGQQTGHIEVVQDVTATARAYEFMAAETARLSADMERLAAGDLSFEAAISEGDEHTTRVREGLMVIAEHVNHVRGAVAGLVRDATALSQAAVEGRLETRADATQHQGDFRRIVEGVNATLDAVIRPLNMAAGYVDRISRGDIPEPVTDEYHGDFNAIKDNLNQCIAGLGGLVEVNEVLQRMAVNDHTRTVTGQYQGVFAEVGAAVNDVRERLLHMTSIARRISVGDLAELESMRATNGGTGRRSDQDELLPAYVAMIESITALVNDTELLSQAAVEGRLSSRAEASRHQGGFRKVVEGVNATLDAVIGPVEEATRALEQMAQRDMTARVAGDYRGDHARIKEALNQAATNLDDGLQQVASASEQVASAAGQIGSGSQAVAQGASEQASSLEEISSSLQEMASMTRQNAANAQEARSLSDAARGSVGTGVDSMRRLSEAIERIKHSSDDTAKIVKTIDEIAFQTNLLALNAAVEAARAGDAGKGFAVVAEEVRNLAMRSAEAAKNTANLIEGSVKNAEQGVAINQEVFANLEEINTQVRKVGEVMAEIAAASEQQSEGIEQVNQAVTQMDQVTQQNAANSEESASAAQELASQAAEMNGLVEMYTLSAHLAAGPAARRATAQAPGRPLTGAGTAVRPVRRPTNTLIPLPDDAAFGGHDDEAVLQQF
jgi:methyl-accepting chemotaxis protein